MLPQLTQSNAEQSRQQTTMLLHLIYKMHSQVMITSYIKRMYATTLRSSNMMLAQTHNGLGQAALSPCRDARIEKETTFVHQQSPQPVGQWLIKLGF